jgi:hypothetical protein
MRRFAEPRFEPVGDLASRLVGEGKGTDPPWIEAVMLDQESNPFDEAVRLPSAGAREHQQRARLGLDGRPL